MTQRSNFIYDVNTSINKIKKRSFQFFMLFLKNNIKNNDPKGPNITLFQLVELIVLYKVSYLLNSSS
jgi:hypothetical protein